MSFFWTSKSHEIPGVALVYVFFVRFVKKDGSPSGNWNRENQDKPRDLGGFAMC